MPYYNPLEESDYNGLSEAEYNELLEDAPPSGNHLYFRSGALLFDKYRRVSFCDKCECSKKLDIPTPCSIPAGNLLPSCVVIRRTNVTRCPECTTTASTGDMPISLYFDGTSSYLTQVGDTFRLPDSPTLKVFAVLSFDSVGCKWDLSVRCNAGVPAYEIWTGEKDMGVSPVGDYLRTGGCDDSFLITVS